MIAYLVLCTILLSTIITAEYSSKTQAQAATALHVEGNKIKDTYDNTLLLLGFGRAGDIESACGAHQTKRFLNGVKNGAKLTITLTRCKSPCNATNNIGKLT